MTSIKVSCFSLGVLAAVATVSTGRVVGQEASTSRPNIFVHVADDFGADARCYEWPGDFTRAEVPLAENLQHTD